MVSYLLSVYTYSNVSPMRSGIFVLSLMHPTCLGWCLTSGGHSINTFFESEITNMITFRNRMGCRVCMWT